MRRMMSKDDVVVVGPERKMMIPRAKDDSNVRLILIENFDFLFEIRFGRWGHFSDSVVK